MIKVITDLGTTWELYPEYHPFPPVMLWDALGLIPSFLDPLDDARGATEQFADKYQGGWNPQSQWDLIDGVGLKYPRDPVMWPIASCQFPIPGVETVCDTVLVYPYGYVCVKHPDRMFEVVRMD